MSSGRSRRLEKSPPLYDDIANNPSNEIRMQKLDQFVRRYEINQSYAEKLRQLNGYEIVFICDDSTSMIKPIGEITNPFAVRSTRWDELRRIVSIVVDLASALDPDGVDVYFLNREPLLHVHSSEVLTRTFSIPPEGSTPIVPVLRRILREKRREIQERKLLILLATDGVPTDENECADINTLRNVLARERNPTNRIPVTIIACTDKDQSMEYLNDWDKEIANLDVVDNYRNEKKQILQIQGKDFPFSFGDYIVKIMMGGVDSWFDDLDEKKVTFDSFDQSDFKSNKFDQNFSSRNNSHSFSSSTNRIKSTKKSLS